jgi:hypothetical protein
VRLASEKICRLTSSITAASYRGSTAFKFASLHVSRLFFEQNETLLCLPFLIGELAGG